MYVLRIAQELFRQSRPLVREMVLLAHEQHRPEKTELAHRPREYAGRVARSGNEQTDLQGFALCQSTITV
jgi:hypothetical protein